MTEELRLISPIKPVSAAEVAAAVRGSLVGIDRPVTSARSVSQLIPGALSFSVGRRMEIDSKAGAIVLVRVGQSVHDGNSYIEAENPRLAFAFALKEFFERPARPGVAASARIGTGVKLGQASSIWENVVIEDNVSIGARSVVQHNAVIHSGTVIGDDCVIGTGAAVGASGFGFERDSAGIPVRISHLGGVLIGNDVEVGPSSTIARGTLSDTIIGDHTKIGTLVNIHHNARIGTCCLIAGHSQISGSVRIGDHCWLGSNCTIRQSVKIGDGATIGLGVLVLEDVTARSSVIGHPGLNVAHGPQAKNVPGDIAASVQFDQSIDELIRETLHLGSEFIISDSLVPNDVPTWDSLAHVNLLLNTQKRFGVTFDVETMAAIRSIGDLKQNLRNRALNTRSSQK